jgi:hypothetical protein
VMKGTFTKGAGYVSFVPIAVMARIPSWKRRGQRKAPPMLRKRGDVSSK